MRNTILLLFFTLALGACSNYGDKVSKDYLEVYYKKGISKEQAQKVLDYFLPLWKDEGEKTAKKSIQLTKNGDTINFRMVSIMSVIEKMDEETFYQTGNEISDDLFNGVPVNVVLTNNKFKTTHTYTYRKMLKPDFGEKISSGNIEVYYKEGSNMEEARRLADYLNTSINPENTISFQISKNDHNFLLRMVSDIEKANALQDSEFYSMAEEISKNVFNGSRLIFQLTNEMFEPFKTFEYESDIPPSTRPSSNQ